MIEHGLGIAHATVRAFGDGPGGGGIEGDVFHGSDVEEVVSNDLAGDGAEIEALAAGEDGGKDFLDLGGGEDEFYVFGGFFEGFEEGVEGGVGEHVDFIDVVDFELTAGGGEFYRFAEFADLFDAIVGGAIDFEDVEGAAFGDFAADIGIRVEVNFGAVLAVEGFGEDACRRGFAGAARAHEEIGAGEAVLLDGVAECFYDMVLAEDIGEGFGTIFSGEYLVAHGGEHRQLRGFVMWGNGRMFWDGGGGARGWGGGRGLVGLFKTLDRVRSCG